MFTVTCYACGRWKDEAPTEAAAARKFLNHYTSQHQEKTSWDTA